MYMTPSYRQSLRSLIMTVYSSLTSGFFRSDLILGIALFTIGVVAAYFFVKYERANEKEKENLKSLS